MPLVWVTGTSGVGKSTACELLKARGALAVDADWEGTATGSIGRAGRSLPTRRTRRQVAG
jgi:adenylate kinase family enzyme